MVECLVAITLLAICAVPVTSAISSAQVQSTEAKERLVVLQEVHSEIEASRGMARRGLLAVSLMEKELDLPLISTPLKIDIKTTLVPGYLTLYQVKVTGTWSRSVSPVELTAWVRSPDG